MKACEIERALLHVNLTLGEALKEMDAIDYESLNSNSLDDQMNKCYQAVFAAGDALNMARHLAAATRERGK